MVRLPTVAVMADEKDADITTDGRSGTEFGAER
jgi:hypothetical protein